MLFLGLSSMYLFHMEALYGQIFVSIIYCSVHDIVDAQYIFSWINVLENIEGIAENQMSNAILLSHICIHIYEWKGSLCWLTGKYEGKLLTNSSPVFVGYMYGISILFPIDYKSNF